MRKRKIKERKERKQDESTIMYKMKNLANLEFEKNKLKNLKVVDKPETMAAFNEKHQKHLNIILCQNKHDPFL